MNLKKVAMWTAGIFLAVILMSALLGSCAGPSAMNGQPGQNGYGGGGPGYQDNSSHGWLWGLGGLAAGYGLSKFFNRNSQPTKPNPDPYKTQTPPPAPKTPDKKVTAPGTNRPQAPSYKPSAPSNSYKPSAPSKKR